MPLYFFDTRDCGVFIEDEEGVELRDIEAAKAVTAISLAELALDVLPSSIRRNLAVEVRDERTLLLKALLHFEAIILVE